MKREWKISLAGAFLVHVGVLSAMQSAPSGLRADPPGRRVEFELINIRELEAQPSLEVAMKPPAVETKARPDPAPMPPEAPASGSPLRNPEPPTPDYQTIPPDQHSRLTPAPAGPAVFSSAPQSIDQTSLNSASGADTGPSKSANTPLARADKKPATPKYRRNPEPAYPSQAKRRRQEGLVLLEVRVGSGGRATKVEVKQSSGFPSLDEAALKAVAGWEFEPARAGDLDVESEIEVPVRFKLSG